ncbi:MAG: VWA domain-containing protein [Candidatus Nanopelagicales bacterium]
MHPRLPEIAAAFGHLLHEAGVPVTPERSARFARAIALADPQTTTELAALGRTTLLSHRDQIEVFDRVFAQVFRGIVDFAEFRGDSAMPPSVRTVPQDDRTDSRSQREGEAAETSPRGSSGIQGEGEQQEPTGEDEQVVLAAVSDEERLGAKSFSECTEEELALLSALVAQLPFLPPMRRARRLRRHPSGDRLDVRATLRASHRTSGDPVHRVHRKARRRPRRVVLIADVSGSMEPYSRVYLHLMRGAVVALGSEAFVFATRLTRLTRQLQHTDPDIAYRRAAAAAPDWSGGTRIGNALKAFLDQHGRRGLARGSVVVVVSDGWELGDPELVGRMMEQLSRLAFHIVWVNPRKAARGYQPLVGGMAAALPYIDTFVSGHSMRALEQVLQAIHDAADDGRRIATVRPLPVVDDTVQPGTSPSAAADPPPAVAASTRSRDIFPTGTLINGSMQG